MCGRPLCPGPGQESLRNLPDRRGVRWSERQVPPLPGRSVLRTGLRCRLARGEFRRDLYYRLAVFPIDLPPLRERRDDIEVIAQGFLDSLAQRTGRGPWRLTERARGWLTEQPWEGNVRELTNALERATILDPGPELDLKEWGPPVDRSRIIGKPRRTDSCRPALRPNADAVCRDPGYFPYSLPAGSADRCNTGNGEDGACSTG